MKHQFNLTPFVDIINKNVWNYAKSCVCHFSENLEPNELYLKNVTANINNLMKFFKYIQTPKRYHHTFDGFSDCDNLFCLIQYIINNDESVKTNLSFLRFSILVSSSISLEANNINIQEYVEVATQFINYVSELINNIADEDEKLEL